MPTIATGAPARRSARPFLKWAGGKRQLLPRLRRHYPSEFGAYLEPFVGSAAVFFDLHALGLLAGRRVVLADINADIMGTYEAVRRDVDAVVAHLERLARGHARHGSAHYYRVRDDRFNPMRREFLARAPDSAGLAAYPAELAAMLIYLNRTGFNGLFRLNARGDFNVPAGRYTNPRICDAPALCAAANALGSRGVEVRYQTFESARAQAAPGDFLYFDPPYAPLSATARFTSYTAGGFGDVEQAALQRLVIDLALGGCLVLLSNSAAPLVRALYARSPDARAAGLRAIVVTARRAINSAAGRRGPVAEYLVTNLPVRRGSAGGLPRRRA